MDQKKDFFDKLTDLFKETDFSNKISFSVNKAGYPFIAIFSIITLLLFAINLFRIKIILFHCLRGREV